MVRKLLTRQQAIANMFQDLTYSICHCRVESESVVQREIVWFVNIIICCPYSQAYQAVVHDFIVPHDLWPGYALCEKGPALCRTLCNGRARITSEEETGGVSNRLFSRMLQTFHGERTRCGPSRVVLNAAKTEEADAGFCWEERSRSRGQAKPKNEALILSHKLVCQIP